MFLWALFSPVRVRPLYVSQPHRVFLSLRWLLREWVGHRCVAYQGRRVAWVNGPLDPTVSIGVLLPVDPTLQNTSASLYDAGLRAKAPPPEPSRPPCLENGNEHFFPPAIITPCAQTQSLRTHRLECLALSHVTLLFLHPAKASENSLSPLVFFSFL